MSATDNAQDAIAAIVRCAAALGRIAGQVDWYREDFFPRLERRLAHAVSVDIADDELVQVLAQVQHFGPLLEQLDGALMSLTGTARQCSELLGKPD